MPGHTLNGFLLRYRSEDMQFYCELAEINHRKAILFNLNGNCRAVELTGRESLFVEDLIDCNIESWEKLGEYESQFDMEIMYRPEWKADISYDDRHIIATGNFTFSENWSKFRHRMNRWMYNNGGLRYIPGIPSGTV